MPMTRNEYLYGREIIAACMPTVLAHRPALNACRRAVYAERKYGWRYNGWNYTETPAHKAYRAARIVYKREIYRVARAAGASPRIASDIAFFVR